MIYFHFDILSFESNHQLLADPAFGAVCDWINSSNILVTEGTTLQIKHQVPFNMQ